MQNQQITFIVPGESPYITPNSAHILQTHMFNRFSTQVNFILTHGSYITFVLILKWKELFYS